MFHCFVCDQKFHSSVKFNAHPCFEEAIKNYSNNKTFSKEYMDNNEKQYKKWENKSEDEQLHDALVSMMKEKHEISELTNEVNKPKEGIKHDSGKPDLSLIPYEALEEIAKALMFGAKKYGRWNWKSSLEYSRLISASLRHVHQFNNKEDNDPESGLSHLAHAICNLMFLLYFVKNNVKHQDNR